VHIYTVMYGAYTRSCTVHIYGAYGTIFDHVRCIYTGHVQCIYTVLANPTTHDRGRMNTFSTAMTESVAYGSETHGEGRQDGRQYHFISRANHAGLRPLPPHAYMHPHMHASKETHFKLQIILIGNARKHQISPPPPLPQAPTKRAEYHDQN